MLYLLPKPRRLRMETGAFCFSPDGYILLADASLTLGRTAMAQLRDDVLSFCGWQPHCAAGQPRRGDVFLTVVPGSRRGGYTLRIDADGAVVVGDDEMGLLHGVQTLRQLVRQYGSCLPALTIDDWPELPDRGFYHDVTRGRVPTLERLKQLAEECCLYKINQLQLYVEHTYLFRDIPELQAVAGTPLTPEEIMALDDHCAALGVELVPSLSTFGHLLELLRLPRFSHLCELPGSSDMPSTMPARMAHHTVNVANPDAFALVSGMIGEYMALFRSRRFNICADETYDLGKGRSRETYPAASERELYMGYLKKLCAFVRGKGRVPMFWGDIALRFPEALKELEAGTICLNWGYSPRETEDATRAFAAVGAVQYVCPGVSSWNQWTPRIRDSYENIRRMAEFGVKYGAAGLLNTDWGDYGHISDPRLSLPGLIFGACAAWNGELPEFDELCRSVSVLGMGDGEGLAVSCMEDLAQAQVYSWWHLVRHKDAVQGMLEGAGDEPVLTPQPEARLMEAEERLDHAEQTLQSCLLRMKEADRTRIRALLTAAEAIRLWNRAGHVVSRGEKDTALVFSMERWLARYEACWRETSKESELWRIRDMTVWYAAQLRGI